MSRNHKEAKEKMNQVLNGLVGVKQNAASLKRVKGEPKVASLEAAQV